MDLMIRWSPTVRNRRVPILVFMGTSATDDRDKEMTIIWEFMVLLGYHMYGMYGHKYSKSMDQPGKVASPARGQLSRKNEYFPVRVRA